MTIPATAPPDKDEPPLCGVDWGAGEEVEEVEGELGVAFVLSLVSSPSLGNGWPGDKEIFCCPAFCRCIDSGIVSLGLMTPTMVILGQDPGALQ